MLAAKRMPRKNTQRQKWIGPYIEQLQKHGKYTLAAKVVGIDRHHVWDERKKNKQFRLACAEALRLFVEKHAAELEEELFRRAKHSTPGEMDTKALLAALRRLDPANYDKPKNQNLNLGGQPGNQLPAPVTPEQQITVIRITSVRDHADAQEFRRIQADRQIIEERSEETDTLAPAVASSNGHGNGKAKRTARGQ